MSHEKHFMTRNNLNNLLLPTMFNCHLDIDVQNLRQLRYKLLRHARSSKLIFYFCCLLYLYFVVVLYTLIWKVSDRCLTFVVLLIKYNNIHCSVHARYRIVQRMKEQMYKSILSFKQTFPQFNDIKCLCIKLMSACNN